MHSYTYIHDVFAVLICDQEREAVLHDWEVQIERKQKDAEEILRQKDKAVEKRETELRDALEALDNRLAEVEEREIAFHRVY